ncbi:sensor histidine kinase [Tumebacillus permanentifrigoris]|uniref:histidine kinase n=1 Tax=Tumebacillus permanentifrigoris TaxID=378543 RepID=A0A316D6V8_9BACL|nr:HAMP domain-containing sensor histidine kinase [Tumebacillus permanentifrigoris]PWK11338.1 signal transduction histidine kinase [Tumebacillus permanentifrigoris]
MRKPVTLLAYWTWRYLLVLVGILAFLAVLAGVWLRSNAYDQAYQVMELRANQVSDQVEQTLDAQATLDHVKPYRALHNDLYIVQVFDQQGQEMWFLKGKNPSFPVEARTLSAQHERVLEERTIYEEVSADGHSYLRVGVPVTLQDGQALALYLTLPIAEAFPTVNRQYGLVSILIGGVALAGWLVIYFLSQKLTQPLRQLAWASQQIAEGAYDPVLPVGVKAQELQQLIGSFHNMAARLKQLEQMRTDLLAGVSHELRTPITSIRGMIQAVQSRVVTDGEADEFLQISLDESKRLQGMVEQLLHVSAIETGAQEFAKDAINLCALVEEVIQQLSVLPHFAPVVFERDFPTSPQGIWVHGDAGALRQVLLNLLNNSQSACQSPDNCLTISLTARVEGNLVQLAVADDGPGIPEEEQPYIFERFYRGLERPRRNHGLGLGLTLSRLLMRAQDGDLQLVSSSEQGTTFQVSLPRIQA